MAGNGGGTRAALAVVLVAGTLLAGPVRAALECRATVNRTGVPPGGTILLQVAVEGDVSSGTSFTLPPLPGVQVTNGGTSQSMTMINGRTRTSLSRSWYLEIQRDADFTVGPVTVKSGGETCRTTPLDIVVADAPPAPPADTGNRTERQPGRSGEPNARAADEIFVTLGVDKDEVWVGEQVILTFEYWRRVQPWNNPNYVAPRTEGFWREELGPERTLRKVLGGRNYNVTEVRYALFPARSGDLVIEPATLSFPEDVFDRFFSNRRRSGGPRTLRTESVTLRVKPLPKPAPAGFSGFVANDLDLSATVDRDTVRQGEPAGLKILLSADGFLKGFEGLKLSEPKGARIHDGAEDFSTRLEEDRLRGRLTVEKVVVPGETGTLTLPPVRLVWFDADRGGYRTTNVPTGVLQVTPGRGGDDDHEDSGFLRAEISRLGEDLAFIQPVPRRLSTTAGPFTGSPAWWAFLAAPACLLGAWRLVLGRISAERRDPALRRRRRALATARAVLRDAARGPADDAPAEIVRAIAGFVADSTGRPAAAVGPEEVRAVCRTAGQADLGDELCELWQRCDAARFGGGDTGSGYEMVRQAEQALTRLASARGRGVPGAVVAAVVLALWSCGQPALVPDPAAAAPTDPVRLLAEGNQAYTEGDLDKALDLYLAVREAGVNDPVLHFNLGNVHARRGELGAALASYERARRLAPRDGDVIANSLWVVRQLRDEELAGDELPLFIRQFVAGARLLSVDEWGVLVLVLAWIIAVLLGWSWYREEMPDGLRRAVLAAVAAAMVAGAVTAWRWHAEEVVDVAMVTATEVEVRSGPAETFPALFRVHDGLAVTVDGIRDSWVRISLGGDWAGWLPASTLERVRDIPGDS